MDLNLIYLVYGLAFFSMGIVVWTRIRPVMDNRLARAFMWLVAFGVIHAINEWIKMFVIMRHSGSMVLFISTFFVALSFALLLQFGIEVIGIRKKQPRVIHLVPAILFSIWFLFYIRAFSYEDGARMAEIWSRYTLGLSGTLLTAYALISMRKRISKNPLISRNFLFAGVFFGFYGMLTVIVPEADFFPASVLNYRWFIGLIGLPVQIFKMLSAIAITYFVVMSLDVFDISEKRMLAAQVEEKTRTLEESEDRYRTLAETASDAIIMIDEENTILFANRAAENIFGYSVEELPGQQLTMLMPESLRHIHTAAIKRHVEAGKRHIALEIVQAFGLHKNGKEIPLEISFGKFVKNGKYIFTGIVRDITERKRAEEELRRNHDTQTVINSLLQLSLEDIPLEKLMGRVLDLILSIPWLAFESKGSIFLVENNNPEVLVMKAQNALSEVIQKSCAQLPFGKCLCGRAALTREIQFTDCLDDRHETRYEGITSHGHYCTPILFADRTLGVINLYLREGHHHDQREEEFLTAIANTLAGIIMRKQAEEKQMRLEQRYRELVEGIDVIVWEADAQTWQFSFVSQRAETVLGYPVNQWLSEPNFRVNHIHPDNRDEVVSFCQEATLEGRNHEFEYQMIAADGSTVWLRDVVAVECAEGKPVRLKGVMIDISPLKEAEEEKKKIQAQLLQAQKMEAIGTLAGGIAHDFNNMLTAIQGYTDLAMMEADETNPLYRDLKQIHHAAVRAADLTRQLLLFSRKRPMEFTFLNINRMVEDLLKMLDRLISEDIVINTDLQPDLWTIRADAGNIEQVVMNLAVNARDAMSKGGKLTIKTKNVTLDKKHCKLIPEARPGIFVCLSVEDTGAGMNKEVIQHIFEPFFSTKEIGKGTGLGLSVVYGIVKQHEGWISVHSKPGHLSTFKIYLPAFSVKLEDETEKTISLQELQGNGERILLVEDEKGVREFITRVLGENGYVVFAAANTKEAMVIFKREKGKFHLVFSDVVLPDKSGPQLVEQLLSLKPELLVLLSSGYTDDKSQWSMIYERGFRFLQKPYALDDLLRTIKEVIKHAK